MRHLNNEQLTSRWEMDLLSPSPELMLNPGPNRVKSITRSPSLLETSVSTSVSTTDWASSPTPSQEKIQETGPKRLNVFSSYPDWSSSASLDDKSDEHFTGNYFFRVFYFKG